MSGIINSQTIRVTKIFTFDMAHALYGYDGPCKNIHGHTYHLYVTVKGNALNDATNPKNGMVMDFTNLKQIVRSSIISKFDHALVLNGNSKHLDLSNLLSGQFEKIIYLALQPSCENLLLHFRELLSVHFDKELKLEYMKLKETPTSYSEWYASDNN